jgi:hypothetical protein
VTIYVESNFVLELASLQEQHHTCTSFIELAVEEHVQLVIPAFSLAEPYETLICSSREVMPAT